MFKTEILKLSKLVHLPQGTNCMPQFTWRWGLICVVASSTSKLTVRSIMKNPTEAAVRCEKGASKLLISQFFLLIEGVVGDRTSERSSGMFVDAVCLTCSLPQPKKGSISEQKNGLFFTKIN